MRKSNVKWSFSTKQYIDQHEIGQTMLIDLLEEKYRKLVLKSNRIAVNSAVSIIRKS